MLYCPNYTCQTPNPETHKFCQKCRTLLPRHYLWALGDGATTYHPGDMLVNRYLCKSPRAFLDTKPGLYPSVPTEIPPDYAPYLRLSPERIHVPQIYDIVPAPSLGAKIVLLAHAAFVDPGYAADAAEPSPQRAEGTVELQLLPLLTDIWQHAPALRQLYWLWQIAHLWQAFSPEQVMSSLLAPELLRVEGPIVRLLELRLDREAIALPQLGQLWSQWLPTAHVELAKPLASLCKQMMQGQFHNAERVIEHLDELLLEVGRSPSRRIQVATRTDQGPSRQRNEDACYPASGTTKTQTFRANQPAKTADANLVIVCDGIGGHQGGDVASNLAIEALRQQIQVLNPERMDPSSLTVALERAVCVANDLISQRNDSEQRHDRQRMGTTLVMGLIHGHELYITHVGDSRAYWVTRQGCYQITLDDDVASREVRLGYSPYREALQQPSAGSLVQALGMGASSALRPTVQRFILDETSVFLLCSDGLSDNDRVEEYWETTLLPLLHGKSDVGAVSQQLINIANTRNGHDNVTVGLLYIEVATVQPPSGQEIKPVGAIASPTFLQYNQDTAIQPNPVPQGDVDRATVKTQVLPARAQPKRSSWLPLLFSIVLLLSAGGVMAYSLSLSFRGWVDALIGSNPPPLPPVPDPTSLSPAVIPSMPTLQAGAFIQLPSVAPLSSPAPVLLLPQPEAGQPSPINGGAIPPGSVLKVLSQRAMSQQARWVQLQICSIPGVAGAVAPTPPLNSETPTAPPPLNAPPAVPSVAQLLQPGEQGWVQENAIRMQAIPKPTLTPAEQGICTASPILETPAPTSPQTTDSSLS